MRTRALVTCLIALLVSLTPAHAAERFFDSDGVRIRYVERGEGEPIVLIHGFSRNVELSWIDPGLLNSLAADHRVIALDCRGHGKSDKPKEAGTYGLSMIEDVRRLLEHLEIGRAHIAGYSMGGRIALKFAALHPERVRSLVLIAAGGARPDDDHRLWDRVAASLENGDGIRPLIEHIWPSGEPAPTEAQIDAISEQTLASNDARALAAVARQYREFATSKSELRCIRVPVLAVIGSRDAFRPSVDRLAALMPQVTVVIVDSASHVSILEHSALRRTIIAFLDDDQSKEHVSASHSAPSDSELRVDRSTCGPGHDTKYRRAVKRIARCRVIGRRRGRQPESNETDDTERRISDDRSRRICREAAGRGRQVECRDGQARGGDAQHIGGYEDRADRRDRRVAASTR
jgi:pimeloyl-ACP methyl ester carboxylesterase